ncbi:type I restriction enzyme HsdR N-terminal domain-containing protein [Flavihumibacter petaseus]|uniref:Type I restriction enzyme R protein N-terminal domain-containing protein n=1 Tax=Flavihumibacter petaseus NBRC 106054 TaxID=1220578 RepID=A0A0E9MUQ4_9BACT|nr:type I restriction enzyme HsdR N-terminal domain-containing protein [Flavihumibacter petaseus]GAO41223.1 hypothetical protein FPE01S_01_02350 [Flavihumibacter petaseus NBRC 106054]
MVLLQFPDFPYRVREIRGVHQVFDETRKRWVQLTPEEWVRQHFIQYLLQVKKYPAALIAVEKEIQLGELNKRFDILVYDRRHQPWLMIECKRPDIQLSDESVHQVLRYNISVPVPYLALTNGNSHFLFLRKEGKLEPKDAFPEWE